MKTKSALWMFVVLVAGMLAGTARAATVSSNATAPAVAGEDIANLVAHTGTEKWWAEISAAGKAMGQTFTTGNSNVSFNAVTYQVNSGAEPTKQYLIRVGIVDKPNPADNSTWRFHEVYRETATQSDAWEAGDYVTWTFDTPPNLHSNTIYGVDVGMTSSTSGWATGIPYLRNAGNTYAGGERFVSPRSTNPSSPGIGDETMATENDRIFHLNLTAVTMPEDTTPPTVDSISDNLYGRPIGENVGSITYWVTFDEDIDETTVDATDFDNAGSGVTFSVDSITKLSAQHLPATFEIVITPSGHGTLQLRIKGDAVITDVSGNAMAVPVVDDTVITINAGIGSLIDEDFQGIMYPNNTSLPTFYGWIWGGAANAIKARNAANEADVPGSQALPNQVIQFEWSTWARYDIWHNWAGDDVYLLSINVSPQSWNGQVQRYFAVKLLQQDNTELWNSGAVAIPLYDNFGRNPWTAAQTFTFAINASAFSAGSVGQPLRFEFTDQNVSTGERSIYWDNVSMTLFSQADFPAIDTTTPADNAVDVVLGMKLEATFDRNIAIGGGNITVRNLTDSQDVVIDATDATQVSVSGAVLTINPPADLVAGKNYAVLMDQGVVADASDPAMEFLGISNTTEWNFTTIANAPASWTGAVDNELTRGLNWSTSGMPVGENATINNGIGVGLGPIIQSTIPTTGQPAAILVGDGGSGQVVVTTGGNWQPPSLQLGDNGGTGRLTLDGDADVTAAVLRLHGANSVVDLSGTAALRTADIGTIGAGSYFTLAGTATLRLPGDQTGLVDNDTNTGAVRVSDFAGGFVVAAGYDGSAWTDFSAVSPPVVSTVGGAIELASTTATLPGELTGGVIADAYICWGTANGGTSTGAWDHVVSMGSVTEGILFSTEIADLLYGIQYYYRIYVTNDVDEAWSSLESFTTVMPIGIPVVPVTDNLVVWFDAGQGVSVSGSSVTQWDDQSGNDYHATLPTGTPELVPDALNGRPEIQFIGESMKVESLTYIREQYVVGRSRRATWNNYGAFLDGQGDNRDYGYLFDTGQTRFHWNQLPAGVSKNGTVLSSGTDYNMTTINEYMVLKIDMRNVSVGDRKHWIGRSGHSASDVDICEIIGYAAELSEADESRVGGYLAYKYGISTTYPAYDPPAPVGIANVGATNVTGNAADIQAILNATQSVFTVYAYYGPNNNEGDAWLGDGAATEVLIGSFTNVSDVALSESLTGLSSGSLYYYTFRAENAATNLWATPNVSFATLGPPVIDAAGGATTGVGEADLNGRLIFDGGEALEHLRIYFGTSDPGATTVGWDTNFVFNVGGILDGDTFSTNVTDLLYGVEYNYRVFASNANGPAWSAVETFTTEPVVPEPVLTADGQTFTAYFEEYDGEDWLLIGRGRHNWEMDTDGQGSIDDISQNLKTTAAFSPAVYSDAIINDLLGQAGLTFPGDVALRIMRATTIDGTGIYQDSRWTELGGASFTFDFDNGSGIPVTHSILNAGDTPVNDDTYAGSDPHSTNTRDNSSQGAGDTGARIFTWEYQSVCGFRYGHNVGTSTAADSFLYGSSYPAPYTEVYLAYPAPVIGAIGITNTVATNRTATTADLVGVLDAAQAVFTVYAYWSTTDHANAAAWLGGYDGSATVGVFTNVMDEPLSVEAAGLAQGTDYYYTLRASNAATNLWATPNGSFRTLAEAPPVVGSAGGAVDIGIGEATLEGVVTIANGDLDHVRIYFGSEDGGTTPANWNTNFVFSVGGILDGDTFSTNVTDLLYGVEYNYRVFASNAYGGAWSAVETFTTTWPAVSGTELTADGQTFDGYFEEYDGEDWLLIGRGRHNWVFGTTGQGSVDDVNQNLKTTAAFAPAYYSDAIVTDLLSQAGKAFPEDIELRIMRATATDGTGPYQDSRWTGLGGTSFTFDFESTISVTHEIKNAGDTPVDDANYADATPLATNTRDNFNQGASETGGRIFTFDHNGIRGFRYGNNVTKSTATDSFLYGGSHAAPYTEVYLAYDAPPSGAVAITNTAAANMTTSTADMVGVLDATQSVFTVTAYWSTNDNADASAWQADTTKASASAGWYTNVMDQAVTINATGLSQGTIYYYTLLASNAATNLWATPNVSFITVAEAPPVMGIAGATNLQIGQATLQGVVSNFNGTLSDVRMYLGAADGGTNAANWDTNFVFTPGDISVDTVFSTNVTDLTYGVLYQYRVFASNSYGSAWSDVASFTTLQPGYFDVPTAIILNGGFESPSIASDGTSTSVDSWTADGAAKIAGPNYSYNSTGTSLDPLGGQFATFHAGSLSQTLNNLVVGESYFITFAEAYGRSPNNNLSIILDEGLGTELVIYNNPAIANAAWEARQTDSFVATKSSYTLTLRSTDPAGFGEQYANIDALVMVNQRRSVRLTNTSASNVLATSASLHGLLDATQSVFQVTAYWSTNDNADASAWQADTTKDSASAGWYTNVMDQAVTINATGLSEGTRYYYTLRASNAATNLWATSNGSFQTLPEAPPSVFRFR